MTTTGPIVDANVHLWDQGANPVFWLTDRTMLRQMLGDYDSLPATYTLDDYRREVGSHDVRGVVWSDPGAADPVAAAASVQRQNDSKGMVVGLVALADPTTPQFAGLVEHFLQIPLVTSVRVRLAAGLAAPAAAPFDTSVLDNLRLLADHRLVATIEANGDQLDAVAALVARLRELRIVIDHFGWPMEVTESAFSEHFERLAPFAAAPNVATRIDAIGTIFGDWTVDRIRPWLLRVAEAFGPDRCMLGSDLPIEHLHSGFGRLYDAYDEIFAGYSQDERAALFGRTAQSWYGRT